MKPGAFIVKHGIRAFPIRRGRKNPPLFGNNLNAATADIATLRKWSKQRVWPTRENPGRISNPPHNYGASLALSGLLVMDVDTKPGKVGAATLANLVAKHGKLPLTLIVYTPSGGFHYYFKQTNTVRFFTGSQSTFGKDIDCPGYVLVPGSVLDGSNPKDTPGPYAVMTNAPIAYAPDWFGIYLQAERSTAVEQSPVVELDQVGNIAWAIDYLKQARPAIEGQNGEHTLLTVAGYLKDGGISRDMAVELLAKYYNDRCEPQWYIGDGPTADRLDVKVDNAYQYLKHRQPGALTAEALFGDDDEVFAP